MERRPYIFTPSTLRVDRAVGESRVDAAEAHDTHATRQAQVVEGLKLVDVAFGVQKIICTAVVNQTLSMDAIIEEITEELFTDEVQSMSMTSMSLL